MPRYFFHVADGSDDIDRRGTELADVPSAQREALRFAGELLIDHADEFWGMRQWSMRVTDADDLTLFELVFLAWDARLAGSAGAVCRPG